MYESIKVATFTLLWCMQVQVHAGIWFVQLRADTSLIFISGEHVVI